MLGNYEVTRPEQCITGYSASVSRLYGDRFALLGNAGEFLDPVFSSGVTIAMKSSSLVVPLVLKELEGQKQDWENDFSKPLRGGILKFRTFVEGWDDTRFQKVIFYPEQEKQVKEKISPILGGLGWEEKEPNVKGSGRRFNVLAELCA